MTCEEVKISLHDYIDGSVDLISKRDIEYHIRNCEICKKEYQKLFIFFDRLKKLPFVIDPPKDILESVRSELLGMSESSINTSKKSLKDTLRILKEKDNQEKQVKKKSIVFGRLKTRKVLKAHVLKRRDKSNIRNTLLTLLPLFVIGIGYFIYDLQKYNYPWSVRSLEGNQKINGNNLQNDLWNPGGVLSTDEKARAKVNVPNIGIIEVGYNSALILEKAKEGSNSIVMERGSIRVVNSTNMPSLTIKVGVHKILDRGGEFSVETDKLGNANINVKYAFVEIVFNDEHYFLKENYSCELRVGKEPGIPIHQNASDTLKNAVESFDELNGGDQALEKIIKSYRESDVLTLLALIPRVSQLQRQIIFQEISNHFPPPESITRAGIIRLDKDMLYKWWEEIEWQI